MGNIKWVNIAIKRSIHGICICKPSAKNPDLFEPTGLEYCSSQAFQNYTPTIWNDLPQHLQLKYGMDFRNICVTWFDLWCSESCRCDNFTYIDNINILKIRLI